MMESASSDQRQWVLEVLAEYEIPLLRFALRLLGDEPTARDCVQPDLSPSPSLRAAVEEQLQAAGKVSPLPLRAPTEGWSGEGRGEGQIAGNPLDHSPALHSHRRSVRFWFALLATAGVLLIAVTLAFQPSILHHAREPATALALSSAPGAARDAPADLPCTAKKRPIQARKTPASDEDRDALSGVKLDRFPLLDDAAPQSADEIYRDTGIVANQEKGIDRVARQGNGHASGTPGAGFGSRGGRKSIVGIGKSESRGRRTAEYSYYSDGQPGNSDGVQIPPSHDSWVDSGRKYSQPTASTPGTEEYSRIVENPFLPAAQFPLSTFSVDVDTASYSNVRRFLGEGRLPPPDAVRIEELINYFRYDYPLPEGKVPFAVHLEAAQCPWRPDHRLLRIGLKGREVEKHQRGPSNLVFLLDVSGSMADADKLPLVKQAMRLLVEQLGENDRVSIVTYADGAGVRLPSARGNQRNAILPVIDALEANGCTNGGAGIQLAYRQAVDHFIPGGVNRIILCTDGDLNVGVTRDDELVRLIQDKARSGVFLTVLGFGTGNLKDGKMEKLADHGHGMYAYIDCLQEARRVFVEQLSGSLVAIAKDVKLQIEFNPAEVRSYRLIGYENRLLPHQDFLNDQKSAGDIGAGHTVTALYEIVPVRAAGGSPQPAQGLKYQQAPAPGLTAQASSGELLTLQLRYKEPEASESRLLEFVARDPGRRFGEASADFRFAAAVAAFGMVLRGSSQRGNVNLAAVEELAAGALGKDPQGHRTEFVDLVRRAQTLAPGR
jgi:Ca-activated chloride channel family protein